MIPEWIIMEGADFLSVSLSITDPDTNMCKETSRRIFPYNGLVYDFWYDMEFVSEENQKDFLIALLPG